MRIEPLRQSGYDLLHKGAIALAEVESNGIRIDEERLSYVKEKLGQKIVSLRTDLKETREWRLWRKRYGVKSNLLSREQLSYVLYDVLGHEITARTEHGRPATDDETLQKIDSPFVTQLSRMLRFEKALNTFVKGIETETVEGRLHPFFNLHTVRTYRSSSDSPNFQNFPVRDKQIAKIIRSLFIASRGCVLAEKDFKGIEVSVSACYHKDTNFISYITTPGKDMHRDMAGQIYKIPSKKVSKDARYGAKNKFVFPQFYGDYYVNCAKSLWEWMEKAKLEVDGVLLKKHLDEEGISRLGKCDPELRPVAGTFEHHVQKVERDFWERRFQQYGEWRRRWYDLYLKRGYFDLLSGFRVHGVFARNAVVNYPVQGSAFHCLLWTLIQVNRLLKKYRMQTKIVGQIHDSLISDVKERELKDYLEIVEHVVTVQLRKHYDWLVVPLEIEYELVPPGKSWFDKKEVKFKKGEFTFAEQTTNDVSEFLQIISA